ncbi:MAG: DUF63 family protein, partial [Candidatus Aenigmarchaeota archaeon]|nr:DUF63 family protein [Candidatus Aenigmarchaeota archaeon]
MENLIYKYFIGPMVNNEGYNPVNTLVYGIILIAATIGVYKALVKFNVIPSKIRMDRDFIKAVFPFVVFGGIIRALEDYGFIGSYLFISPFIYIVIFSLAFPSILLGVYLRKRMEYWKLPFSVGLVLVIYALANIKSINPFPVLATFAIASAWFVVFELAGKWGKLKKLFTRENNLVMFCQMVDGTATFIAIGLYGNIFWEQHFVSRFFIQTFGTWSFFLLKLFV